LPKPKRSTLAWQFATIFADHLSAAFTTATADVCSDAKSFALAAA
jgi:hypothetical protein